MSEPVQPIVLEDEGRLIGRISMPPPLQFAMKTAPVIVLEEALPKRVEHIFTEYIVQQWDAYQEKFDDRAMDKFSEYLLGAVDAIKTSTGAARPMPRFAI